VLLCKLCHLDNLGFGYIARVNAASRRSFVVYLQHELLCAFVIDGKKPLQHLNDKFHRRVIVVEQNYLVHAGRLGAGAFRREYCAAVMFVGHIFCGHSDTYGVVKLND